MINQNEITLENLREGKFTTKDIPHREVERLWKEEYETLPEEAKELHNNTNWRTEPFVRGQKNKDGSPKQFKDWQEFAKDVKEKEQRVLDIENQKKHWKKTWKC